MILTCRRRSTFQPWRSCRASPRQRFRSDGAFAISDGIRFARGCSRRQGRSSPSLDSRAGPSGGGRTWRRWRPDVTSIRLPRTDGTLHEYTLRAARRWAPPVPGAHYNRVAYAAAYVVADPLAAADPWIQPAIDWDATLAYRSYLWSLGFGVAEAMDTAQRGMGLDWPTSLELIDRSLRLARDRRAQSSHAVPAPTIWSRERRRPSTMSSRRTNCSAKRSKAVAAVSS